MLNCKDQCRGESGPEPAELCGFKDLVLTNVHHHNEIQNKFIGRRDLFSSVMELDYSGIGKGSTAKSKSICRSKKLCNETSELRRPHLL